MLKAVAHPSASVERVCDLFEENGGGRVPTGLDRFHYQEHAAALNIPANWMNEGQSKKLLGVSHLLAALFNAVEIAGHTTVFWKLIMVCALFKDKVDPMAELTEDEIDKIEVVDHQSVSGVRSPKALRKSRQLENQVVTAANFLRTIRVST